VDKLVYFKSTKGQGGGPKILHISPLPPPWGGVASNLSCLLKSDALSVFNMAVLNTAQSSYREDVHPSKPLWDLRRLMRGAKIWRYALAAVREFKPDIVHIQSAGLDSSVLRDMLLIPLLRRSVRGICFQQHFWADPARLQGSRTLFKYLYRKLMPQCDALLMCTPLHIEQAERLIPIDRAHYLPNTCVPPENWCGTPNEEKASICQVVCIGRLSKEKGTYDLLNAIKMLSAGTTAFRFVLIGVGATSRDEVQVAQSVLEGGLERCTVLAGRVTETQKWETLKESHIMVHPTHGELLPVTLIEGLAAALPVITTSVDYLPGMIVNGENGLIVPPRSPERLAEAILELGLRPDIRERMREVNLRKFRGEFAQNVVSGKLRRIYEDMLLETSKPGNFENVPK
jgi:glycosyltransferase involved in cell wall biosynthesis